MAKRVSRTCGGFADAGELCSNVVDDEVIAVRAIVIPQANISTHRLRVRSIELNQPCKY
jgi:hypothetical protein